MDKVSTGAGEGGNDLAQIFALDPDALQGIVTRFQYAMKAGLEGRESPLAMLPAYLGRPQGTECGTFLVLDMGGTNTRVFVIRLQGQGEATILAHSQQAIPTPLREGDSDALFDYLAQLIRSFMSTHHLAPLPLAFTFSYPVEQRSLTSGILLHWTKGLTVRGVVGHDVGVLFVAALRRAGCGDLPFVALINDTVGTLLAAAYRNPTCDLAVILGTGTNACYPERTARLSAHRGPFAGDEVILNLEWGAFPDLPRNRYDELLDQQSPNPGQQIMEKMVSGLYLGELVRLILTDLSRQGTSSIARPHLPLRRPYALTAKHLSRLMDDPTPGREELKSLIEAVTVRSARIVAAGIVAVLTHQDPLWQQHHTVAIDGALFTGFPGYSETLRATIPTLLPASEGQVSIVATPDGSGIGAAIAAAMASAR